MEKFRPLIRSDGHAEFIEDVLPQPHLMEVVFDLLRCGFFITSKPLKFRGMLKWQLALLRAKLSNRLNSEVRRPPSLATTIGKRTAGTDTAPLTLSKGID